MKTKAKPPKTYHPVVGFAIDPEYLKKIEREAEKEQLSRSDILRRIIRKYYP